MDLKKSYLPTNKELKDLKREIGQVIEASTLAYDQRDEAHSKIVLLKEKADKDLQLFNAEIKVKFFTKCPQQMQGSV